MAMFHYASFNLMAIVVVVLGLFACGNMAQMLSGDILTTGQNISNAYYTLVMQPDCNLVLYSSPSKAEWSTQTSGKGSGCELRLQIDGNLVIYAEDEKLIWQTGTNGTVGRYVLLIQRNRNIVIYSESIWDSGTGTVLPALSITN